MVASLPESPAAQRILGYDVARALAILGMVVVHFSLVMAKEQAQPAWLALLLDFLDGRAAATFVVLAGIGITLMSRRAVESQDPIALASVRHVLIRRGLFLLVLGFIHLAFWPGDILRVYGISLMVAATLLTATNRRLLAASAGFVLGFLVLICTLDFEQNWDWDTLEYHNLWTPTGVLRNLFYDGFRSIFPWTGFVLFGMYLGRLRLRDPHVNRCVLISAAIVTAATEFVSWLLVSFFAARPKLMTHEEAVALFGTESMPALPLFLLSAGGTAVFVIALCVRLSETWPTRAWDPLVATGQMALTWYLAHIFLGIGTVVALGLESSQSLPVGALTGVTFFAAATIISWLWKRHFRHGPLEWLMREFAG